MEYRPSHPSHLGAMDRSKGPRCNATPLIIYASPTRLLSAFYLLQNANTANDLHVNNDLIDTTTVATNRRNQ